MPDNLKNRCHHCHKPNPTTNEEIVKRVREWVDKGEAWAQRMMAQWYQNGMFSLKQSFVMAAMLYEKAVAQGDPNAMFNLAHLYRDGKGVAQSHKKAAELFTMAADQGHASAMNNLGLMYQKGEGVAQSYHQAFELYTVAAGQEQVNAIFALGCLYRDGQGVAKSYQKAVELFTMAAEKGEVGAMTSLGISYIQGQGVAQSNELAREWWTTAANKGHAGALNNLRRLDEQEGESRKNKLTSVCCSSCNKPQPSGHTFRKCLGCRTVQYCNKECQRAHWRPGGHKQECKRLRKKKEEKRGSSSSHNQNQNKTSKST